MRTLLLSTLLALGTLGAFACSSTVEKSPADGAGGDTATEPTPCEVSSHCGSLQCLCGACQSACDGASDCSLAGESSCVGGSFESDVPELTTAFEVRVEDVDGNDLALGPDASLFVVGGKTRTTFDLSYYYPDFWLACVDEAGNVAWQVHEPNEGEVGTTSTGVGVAFDGTSVTTLSTLYSDSERTRVARFDSEGSSLGEELLLPELTVARALPNEDGLVLAGTELVSWNEGRPFMRARVERSPDTGGKWPALFQGVEGGVSQVEALAVDADGNVSVSGNLGTDPLSNESVPWVARLAPDGSPIFQTEITVSDIQHCSAGSVSVTDTGVTLVSGICEGSWLKAYSPEGTLLWERRFPNAISAVAATDKGRYVVATGIAPYPHETFNPDDDFEHAELLAFDADHRLLARVTEDGCAPFHRLMATGDGVVALARCSSGMLLAKYDIP